ncbi:DUF4368 domain-containing protein [Neobacillus drentensis]|uniref:DUF4368 domain-containing protein n=1 Tax=Neobacillus drentensis TaxID=220684 RepID=UPI003B58A750
MVFKELTPEILHRLIDRIEIKADGSPRIFYRFSNPAAYSLICSVKIISCYSIPLQSAFLRHLISTI